MSGIGSLKAATGFAVLDKLSSIRPLRARLLSGFVTLGPDRPERGVRTLHSLALSQTTRLALAAPISHRDSLDSIWWLALSTGCRALRDPCNVSVPAWDFATAEDQQAEILVARRLLIRWQTCCHLGRTDATLAPKTTGTAAPPRRAGGERIQAEPC